MMLATLIRNTTLAAAYVAAVEGLMAKYEWVADRVHRRKMAREAARSVLPNATEVKIVVSGNVRAWRTMLELRLGEGRVVAFVVAMPAIAEQIDKNIFPEFLPVFNSKVRYKAYSFGIVSGGSQYDAQPLLSDLFYVNRALEPVGERAFELHDKPDASLWEFRGRENVHTYSAVMCWAACDRLGNAAAKLGLLERADKGEVAAAQERCGAPAWNLPMVAGPIAISYNLPGVDSLVLTPAIAADIFSGAISTWNDPAIARANPAVTLPGEKITVFFRSDESGTTENFTKYLQAAAPAQWAADPGKKWTGTGEGREKSSGVADGVKQTQGSVTYVEWSYAKDNQLGIAKIDNGSGPVELTGQSAGEAVSVAKVVGEGNDLRLELDYATKAPGAYPIVLVTYEVVCSTGLDAEKTALEKAFLSHFASTPVQQGLEEIGYAPLPADVTVKVETAIAAIS